MVCLNLSKLETIYLKGAKKMKVEKLVAVHRNHHGEIMSFQTSGGRIISYRKALLEAEEGKINGVNLIEAANGTVILTPADDFSFEQYPEIN
jgi:hypothetical protein